MSYNRSKQQKVKSDSAADKALKGTTSRLVEQLNLFETTLRLHSMGKLTRVETEKLGNSFITESERKQYLLTTVIPSKGYYRGMRLLRRALKQSNQFEIVNVLEKAYEDAVDAKEFNYEAGVSHQTTTSNRHDSITSESLNADLWNHDISISGNSEDDIHTISHPPVQQQLLPPLPSCVNVALQLPVSQANSSASVSVVSTAHRPRSNHICCKSNPYKHKANSPEQAVSVTVNVNNENTDIDLHDRTRTIQTVNISVNQLQCDIPVIKFVFVGDPGTGKTSLLDRYVNNKFSIAFNPTLSVDFKSTEVTCYDTKYKLYLWDTAGQERFNALTKAYYRDALGGFVVYDVTQRISLEHCSQWKKEIDDVVQLRNDKPIPIVLIANKVDCGQLDGEEFSKEHGFAGYFETSAKTGAGIKEAIHFTVKKVHELSYTHQESAELNTDCAISIKLQLNKDHLSNDTTTSGRKCCLEQ